MIVKMKKAFVIGQKKHISSVAESLRDLGTVHVEHLDPLEDGQLFELREEVSMLTEAIAILKQTAIDVKQQPFPIVDWRNKVNDVLELSTQAEHFKEDIKKREAEINQWNPWGDFEPADVQELSGQGIYIYLAEMAASEKLSLPREAAAHLLHKVGKLNRFMIVSRQKIDSPFILSALPAMSLEKMILSLKEIQIKLNEAEEKLEAHCRDIHFFENIFSERSEELRLKEVMVGMKDDESLAILKGFLPVEECAGLEAKAKKDGWGLVIEEPSGEDSVPTLIRNPKWVQIIKPVFDIINVLPGYKEVDISMVFLFFFSIFFGVLIGDAGYGLIFLSVTLFVQSKLRGKVQSQAPFILMYVLSGCAIVWGILTGTMFGTILLAGKIKPVLAWLTENKNVQLFCFFLGAVHLTIAHLWRFLIKLPAFAAVAELGWVSILWCAFFLANNMILGMPLPWFEKSLAMGGISLIILELIVTNKGRIGDILIGAVLGFFSVISAFTDVVSYIRLFAVGLAGVAVADAFNQMALSVGFNGVVASLITVLILVAGHLFNVVLSCFGILVHGLRLNVLEFSGHLGLEWAGSKYDPFKNNNNKS